MAFPVSTGRNRLLTSLAMAGALTLALASCSSPSGEQTESGTEETTAAVVSPPSIIKADRLSVCTSNIPPNIFYDDNNGLQGVEIDIAKALASQLGIEASFEEYAFSGLIPALQAKQCDVIMGSLYIKPEREEIANFVPYLYSGTGVGVSEKNPKKITGFDDTLCGTNIVAITGATGGNRAAELSAQCESKGLGPIDITLLDEKTGAVQQVISGQVDAFVDTSEMMRYYEGEANGSFQMIGEPAGKIRIGAATLKGNTELNEALDTAFQALVDDGSYLEILKKWDVASSDITQSE